MSERDVRFVDASILPAPREQVAAGRDALGREGREVAVILDLARPLVYQHVRCPGRMHRGEKRRMDNYIRGGLTSTEIGRLCGVTPGCVRQRRIVLRAASGAAA